MEKKQIIIASILGIAFVLGLSFAAYQVSRTPDPLGSKESSLKYQLG